MNRVTNASVHEIQVSVYICVCGIREKSSLHYSVVKQSVEEHIATQM